MEENNKNNEEKTYKVGEVMSMLEQINDGVQLISEQHSGIVSRLDGIDSRLNGLENSVNSMKDDLTEIKHKLSEKVDREEFNRLEERTVKLEKLVFAKLS